MNVSIFAGTDSRLLDVVASCGARATLVTAEELAAMAHPAAAQPDVLIVDQRDRAAVPPAVSAIKAQHPSTGILMVLPRLDGALVLEAMRAGANECVAEPVTRAALSVALGLVAKRRLATPHGEVFAVVGAKGGVGASTVAVNVATALHGLRPGGALLVDLHTEGGDAATYLGAEPQFSVADALQNMHRMDATFFRTLVTRTDAGPSLLAAPEQAGVPCDASQVRRLIELAAAEFTYVVLDVARTEPGVLDSLGAATRIAVVANQEVATVRRAARLVAELERRYGKDRVGVVLSRYDDRSDIGVGDVERVVACPVTQVLPNCPEAALASSNSGRPLVLGDRGALSSALASYARAMAGVAIERREPPRSLGLLFRLAGSFR